MSTKPTSRICNRRAKVSALDTYSNFVYLAIALGAAVAIIGSGIHP